MRPRTALLLLAAALAIAACGGRDTGDEFTVEGGLRSLAPRTKLLIGSAVGDAVLAQDPTYASALQREFNYVTPENEMKWGVVHPQPDVWNFDAADRIVDFAEAHDMDIKGHTLLWRMQLPAYVDDSLSADALRAAIDTHIRTLVGRYSGRVRAWDVINEPLSVFGSGLDSTVFTRTLGPEYIADAFRLAHEVDPKARLYLNEFGAEGLGTKSDTLYELVAGLVRDRVPIDGVGFQMHLGYIFGAPPTTLQENLQRFAALGLRVNISEMDYQIRDLPGDDAARLAAQGDAFRDVVNACLAVRACEAVTFWGFTDKYSWIDSTYGADDPLLFDDFFQPKPAYFDVFGALVHARRR